VTPLATVLPAQSPVLGWVVRNAGWARSVPVSAASANRRPIVGPRFPLWCLTSPLRAGRRGAFVMAMGVSWWAQVCRCLIGAGARF